MLVIQVALATDADLQVTHLYVHFRHTERLLRNEEHFTEDEEPGGGRLVRECSSIIVVGYLVPLIVVEWILGEEVRLRLQEQPSGRSQC